MDAYSRVFDSGVKNIEMTIFSWIFRCALCKFHNVLPMLFSPVKSPVVPMQTNYNSSISETTSYWCKNKAILINYQAKITIETYLDVFQNIAQPSTCWRSSSPMCLALDLGLKIPSYPCSFISGVKKA